MVIKRIVDHFHTGAKNMTQCNICTRECAISEGRNGFCGQYVVKNGCLTERFPNQYLVSCPISVETMPILHAYPGETFFQISTLGCNLSCEGCISTIIVKEMGAGERVTRHIPPEKVVDMAVEHGCRGIVFLMNDPLASYFTFLSVARAAKSRGLAVGCSTNGLFTETSLAQLMPLLDFVNLGMKGMWDASYASCGALGSGTVLENLKTLHKNGIHVEISCMLRTDNREEIKALARFVSSLSPSIPFQVMRFIPFENADISLEPAIGDAEDFCLDLHSILAFVYLFNSPGTRLLNTYCPACNHSIFQRDFYGPMGAKLLTLYETCPETGYCPSCNKNLHITGKVVPKQFSEKGFEGGYPFTRALEMVQAMVIAMGITAARDMMVAWESILHNKGLQTFHHDIQEPVSYIALIRRFGSICGRTDSSEILAAYLEEKLSMVQDCLAGIRVKPKVYYAMGTPLFALNGGRLENRLVEYASGISVNKRLKGEGRPGRTIRPDQINTLNPDVIFISAFISEPVPEFYSRCLKSGITANAVVLKQIHTHPAPGWDFGSPRWILGLMFIASVLHPDQCDFDVIAEARYFYRTFYNIDFNPLSVNRSFSKPSRLWRWDSKK